MPPTDCRIPVACGSRSRVACNSGRRSRGEGFLAERLGVAVAASAVLRAEVSARSVHRVFADEVVQPVSRRVRKLRADEAVRLFRSVDLPVQGEEQLCVRQSLLLLELDGVGVAAYSPQGAALPDVREEGLEAEVEGAGDDVRAIVHAAGSHERAPNLWPARVAGEGHEEVGLPKTCTMARALR